MSYRDRVAIVTGASSGLGRALAVGLAARGARVGLIARRADRLADVAAEVREAGGVVETAAGDVTDRAGLRAAVEALAGRLGQVDLMVANAGVALPSHAADPADVAHTERMAAVNYLGVVYAFDAVLPAMLARRSGHLVAVSSLAAYKGLPGSAGYTASKAAVNAYCEAARIELRDRGVAVTCVCPGFVATPMTAANTRPMPMMLSAEAAAERILKALLRRPGVYAFPRPMRALLWLAKWAPDRLIARRVGVRVATTPPDAAAGGRGV